MKRVALCIGLTRLDPAAWDGWTGDCPGCDQDLLWTASRAHTRGFDGVGGLTNALASAATLGPLFDAAVRPLEAGDLLVLSASCHGGQVPDTDGDEADGLDETLCLWDGELVDDLIAEQFANVPRSVRIWFITDSCHSKTVHRGRIAGVFGTPRYEGPLLHWAGCDDPGFSWGDKGGGAFTRAFSRVESRARRELSYGETFERIVAGMEGQRQTPQMIVEGGFDLDRPAWS